ncbi:MAG: translocation/assembly module TamB, partial [Bdellovibrionaceae bacterium]|nr:translocation/assembly module TamB [Pseudobdellovibrionaceae bacterium]
FKDVTGFDVSATVDDVNSVAVPKITASRKFTPKFGVRASQSLGNSRKTEAKAEYQLSRGISVVGSWEGQDRQESVDTTGQTQENQDKFGLDLEYRFEFK